jgi:methyl acetate hydrolase
VYGINTDWLGEVIEAAGAKKLDEAIKAGVTDPLAMNETAFVVSDEQRARAVPVHLQGPDGAWAPSEIDLNQAPDYWAGGHGLHSTPRDYLKFQRCSATGPRPTASGS